MTLLLTLFTLALVAIVVLYRLNENHRTRWKDALSMWRAALAVNDVHFAEENKLSAEIISLKEKLDQRNAVGREAAACFVACFKDFIPPNCPEPTRVKIKTVWRNVSAQLASYREALVNTRDTLQHVRDCLDGQTTMRGIIETQLEDERAVTARQREEISRLLTRAQNAEALEKNTRAELEKLCVALVDDCQQREQALVKRFSDVKKSAKIKTRARARA